jgi:hypothetical protein
MEPLWSINSLVTEALFVLFVYVIALAKRWDADLNAESRIEARPLHVAVGTWTSVPIARIVQEKSKSADVVPEDPVCLEEGVAGVVYGAKRTEIWVFVENITGESILGLDDR